MTTPYADWAARWVRGMEAAQPMMTARRDAQRAVAVANRKRGAGRLCAIKDCKRHAYKAALCRKHWAMVPYQSKVALMVDCIAAQQKVAAQHHRRIVRELQAQVRASDQVAA